MPLPLKYAETALQKGDYAQCIELLEPLAKEHPITGSIGANIRMLMVTAWMGQGEEVKAIATCRLLTKCKDEKLRSQAKQLLSVLEAPSLPRPRNWSVELPEIGFESFGKQSTKIFNPTKKKSPSPSYPPTGPTKSLQLGFSTLVLSILIVLTMLLSGCVAIATTIDIPGPDRVSMKWQIDSSGRKDLPWLIEFKDSTKKIIPKLNFQDDSIGLLKVDAPILSSLEANNLLNNFIGYAAISAGFDKPKSELILIEKNWFIGVQQNLKLSFDLSSIPDIPGLDLSIKILPINTSGSMVTPGKEATKIDNANNFEIKTGKLNNFEVNYWHWNSIGIGVLIIFIALFLSLVLQKIRLEMGFGYSQLPP